MFRVERQTLLICLFLFRLVPGPSNFHKVNENSNSCLKEVEWDDYILSRRNLVNHRAQGRFIDTHRHSHFSPSKLGLCHQLQEVCVRPMPCVGISRIGNRFSEYEGRTSQEESSKDQENISIFTLVRKSLSEGFSKVNRETLFYSNGSSSVTSTVQGPSATTKYRFLHEGVIRRHNCVTEGGKNRTGLAGAESESEQRMVHTVNCHTDRSPIQCFQVRVGAVCQGQSAGGPWSQEERREHINLLELKISTNSFGFIYFCRGTKIRVNSLADGQSDCINVHEKNGG